MMSHVPLMRVEQVHLNLNKLPDCRVLIMSSACVCLYVRAARNSLTLSRTIQLQQPLLLQAAYFAILQGSALRTTEALNTPCPHTIFK
jgi:hypothetical protein